MINKLKKVSFRDIIGMTKFILVLIPSLLYKIYLKSTKKELWLICETEFTARDNGYVFYKFMKEKHPEINCWYAIGDNCSDYNKVKKLGNIVKWSSIKHYFYYMSATKNISSHKEGNPNQSLFTVLHLYLNLYNNRIFLQHGITKDDAEMFYYKNTKFKCFICGAKKEYEFIKDKFGYPEKNVVYTGFARFDNLHDIKIKNNKILLIPTWRRWFELVNNNDEFKSSEYFKRWNCLINNKDLIEYLEKNNIELIFYPHLQMKKFINSFDIKSKNVSIINDKEDIQKILKECALMITDYSSVYMDFAYMKKPIIYYQFDYEQYRKSHFKEGFFSYENDGFGPIIKNEQEVVIEIIKQCNANYKVRSKYKKRMDLFFELNDKNNCKRIYNFLINDKVE